MKVKQDFIPIGKVIRIDYKDKDGKLMTGTITRRSGTKMDWDTITVHNNANPKSSAENERAWLTNPTNQRQASWHYVIKEDLIIQAIPDNEQAYHAGDGRGPGNTKSIGVEICESGDFEHSKRTAAKFIAAKLKEKGKGLESVKQHHDWSGKDCPRLIRPVWPAFIAMIKAELVKEEDPTAPWKLEGLKYLHAEGLVSDYDGWAAKIDDPMPAWAVFTILQKMDLKRKG